MKESERNTAVETPDSADVNTSVSKKKRSPITTLFVFLLSLLTGFLIYYVNSCRVQLNAIAELDKYGAQIDYEPGPYADWLDGFLPSKVADRVVGVRVVDEKFRDVTVLANLPSIRKLYLVSTGVYDISSLSRLWDLEELCIDSSPVRDLSPLQSLDKLRVLRFSDTKVRDLTPVAELKLEKISFSNTSIWELEPLRDNPTLESLVIANTRIRDLEPLGLMPELRSIKMDNSNVKDLRPLEKMKKLNNVSFSGLPIVPSQVARLDLFLPEWECPVFND